MSAEFIYSSNDLGGIQGSTFGEPDGMMHGLFVLSGNGNVILRVTADQSNPELDLILTFEQAKDVAIALLEAHRREIDSDEEFCIPD